MTGDVPEESPEESPEKSPEDAPEETPENSPPEFPEDTPEQVISRELTDGETLLWSGRPNRAAYSGSNPFRAIFGRIVLVIGAVMIYLALDAMSVNPRSPGVFALMFGIIFSIFGGGLAGKTFWHWWSAPTTYYGVTDRRALIVRTRTWLNVRYFPNNKIEFVAAEPFGSAGLGNVLFATEPFGRLRALRAAVGFWGIENPGDAESALQTLKDTFA